MKNESHVGQWGWLALGLSVTAWDALANETLTHAFHRTKENPTARILAVGALAYTAAHLLDIIPDRYDALDRLPELGNWIVDKVVQIDTNFYDAS